MTIKPVRNETRHDAALAEIDRLMGVAPDTPESDKLEVLVTLVERYESEHWDIIVANVGALNAVYFNRGGGAAGFGEFRFGCEDCATYGVAVGDLNGDGFPEIVTANSGAPNGVFENVGVGR